MPDPNNNDPTNQPSVTDPSVGSLSQDTPTSESQHPFSGGGTPTAQDPPAASDTVLLPSQDPSATAAPASLDDNQAGPPPETLVTTAPHAPKKYGGKKVIATIFGILFLIGGVAAGVYLVQRQQQLAEEAASGAECQQAPDCILIDNAPNSDTFTAPKPIRLVKITNRFVYEYQPGDTNDGCYHVVINGNFLSWNRVGTGPDCKDVSNVQVWLGTDQATPTNSPSPSPTPTLPPDSTPTPTTPAESTPTPTLPPGVTAQCGEVKAYDTQWNLLSADDLKSLSAGDVVRFAVAGTASSGTFDKARFTINGVLRAEVTTKKPGTSEFYDQYTVPAGVTSFTVSAQVHHEDLGWF